MLKVLALATLLVVGWAARDGDLIQGLPLTDCKLPTKTYSGYLRTQSKGRKLHYVYVESMSKPQTDPVLVWFNGGPGCSSMLGFIQEHGPCVIEDFDTKIQKNPYPWNQKANVLYLESPAGVGFSWAATQQDKMFTDHSQSVDTFAAIRAFYEDWPELLKNPLYITGESYAGIYAPFLAMQIHEWNVDVYTSMPYSNTKRLFYPLAGFIIGNGVTNWEYDGPAAYMEALFQNYRVNETIYQEWNKLECKYWYRNLKTKNNPSRCDEIYFGVIERVFSDYSIYDLNRPRNKTTPTTTFERYLYSEIDEMGFNKLSFEKFRTKYEDHIYLRSDPAGTTPYVTEYLNKPEVRKALNIPQNIQEFEICNDEILTFYRSQMQASQWIYKKLRENYKLLHYSGTTDGAVPTNGTKNWIKDTGFEVTKPQRSWTTNGNFSGHITEYGKFWFATVHGTGHMAPQWKRPEVTGLITKFIHDQEIN